MTNPNLSPLAQAAIAVLERVAEEELPVVLQWLEEKIAGAIGGTAPTAPAPAPPVPSPGPADPPPVPPTDPAPQEDVPTKP